MNNESGFISSGNMVFQQVFRRVSNTTRQFFVLIIQFVSSDSSFPPPTPPSVIIAFKNIEGRTWNARHGSKASLPWTSTRHPTALIPSPILYPSASGTLPSYFQYNQRYKTVISCENQLTILLLRINISLPNPRETLFLFFSLSFFLSLSSLPSLEFCAFFCRRQLKPD